MVLQSNLSPEISSRIRKEFTKRDKQLQALFPEFAFNYRVLRITGYCGSPGSALEPKAEVLSILNLTERLDQLRTELQQDSGS